MDARGANRLTKFVRSPTIYMPIFKRISPQPIKIAWSNDREYLAVYDQVYITDHPNISEQGYWSTQAWTFSSGSYHVKKVVDHLENGWLADNTAETPLTPTVTSHVHDKQQLKAIQCPCVNTELEHQTFVSPFAEPLPPVYVILISVVAMVAILFLQGAFSHTSLSLFTDHIFNGSHCITFTITIIPHPCAYDGYSGCYIGWGLTVQTSPMMTHLKKKLYWETCYHGPQLPQGPKVSTPEWKMWHYQGHPPRNHQWSGRSGQDRCGCPLLVCGFGEGTETTTYLSLLHGTTGITSDGKYYTDVAPPIRCYRSSITTNAVV